MGKSKRNSASRTAGTLGVWTDIRGWRRLESEREDTRLLSSAFVWRENTGDAAPVTGRR